jgi:hypothetical protein
MKTTFDADQERLYKRLMLVAENDGDAYRANCPTAAAEQAYKDHRRNVLDALRADFAVVRFDLIGALSAGWDRTRDGGTA